jgi:hypothetical protein
VTGWFRLTTKVATRDGKPIRAHWVDDVDGRVAKALCFKTGPPSAPGIAPHCETCEKRRRVKDASSSEASYERVGL